MNIFRKSITGLRDSQNKYFIFKNANRRKSIRTTNFFINFLFVLCFIAMAISFVWLSILFIGGFLGFFLMANYIDTMITPGITLLVATGVYALFYVLKFFIEGFYIRTEVKELNIDAELNKNHISISKAVGKVRKLNLISMLIGLALSAVGATCAIFGVAFVTIIALVIIIVLYVTYRILKFKTYVTVHDEIVSVIAERKELRKAIK